MSCKNSVAPARRRLKDYLDHLGQEIFRRAQDISVRVIGVSRQLSHGGSVSLKKQDAVLERLDRAEPNFKRRDLDSAALVLEGSLAYSRI
jgi:hypothetical protein